MKKSDFLWAVIVLPLFFQHVYGQAQFVYHYRVNDLSQKPLAGVRVTAVETSTFDYAVFYTNEAGIAEIRLATGNQWSVNVGDMRAVELITMPTNGTREIDGALIFDPELWKLDHSPTEDRSEIIFAEIQQNLSKNHQAEPAKCLVGVELKDELSNPWANLKLSLVNPSQRLTISAQTNGEGIAYFEVSPGFYDIDVDGETGFKRIAIPADTSRIALSYRFITKDFTEAKNAAGHIVQKLNNPQKVVSNRVHLELMVTKQNGNPANEKVLIRTANSNITYLGYTNAEGDVDFMLPKGRIYSVNFEFQENAATFDLTPMETTGRLRAVVPYIPDERLAHPERFLPKKEELKTFNLNHALTSRYEDTPDDYLVNFHAKWGNNRIGSGSTEAVIEMGFSVKSNVVPQAVDKPVNLVFVLDKSGSMSFERIDLLKFAMAELIDKLRPSDKACIVVFDTQAAVAYPLSSADQNRLKDVVYAIQANGGTSIYEGLKLGYQNINKVFDPAATNRVILLTDGYGSKPVDEVLDLSKKYFDKGIAVSTIGIGEGYNHNLLNLLSQYSGGMAHQAFSNKDLTNAFAQEFESIMYPLASNFQVTVTYNNEIVYNTLFGIPDIKEGQNYVNFRIPTVFSSMNQTALMKFKLDNPTPEIANEPVIIRVNYFDEQKGMPVEIVKEMKLEWTDETDLELVTTEQQKRIYSLAVINQCNKVIADLCDNQDFEAAEKELKETLRALQRTNDGKFSADFKPYIKQLEDYLIAIQTAIKNQPKKENLNAKWE